MYIVHMYYICTVIANNFHEHTIAAHNLIKVHLIITHGYVRMYILYATYAPPAHKQLQKIKNKTQTPKHTTKTTKLPLPHIETLLGLYKCVKIDYS